MFAFKVAKHDAEGAKRWLRAKDLLAPNFSATRDAEFVFFPVTKTVKPLPFAGEFVKRQFEEAERTISFREALVGVLGKKAADATASYDTIGGLAIIEVPNDLRAQEKAIAKTLLESNKRLKTVLRKDSAMEGEFRVRRLKWLAGKKTFEVEYRENGCVMRFDLRKTYFSTRLCFERARIASLVKPKEKVLALFAGVGPFALVIAKRQPAAKIIAIELNPYAVKMMEQNIAANKAAHIKPILGDVREILKKYPKWADRVTMPLPHTGHDFLDVAIKATKNGGTIHFYGFGGEKEGVFTLPLKAVKAACKKEGVGCSVVEKRVVRPYAPSVFQVVIDFKVKRKR